MSTITMLLGLMVMAAPVEVERITTAVPFPRGLVLLDGQLHVLSRGRVRDVGGVDPKVEDRAGTIWVVDPGVSQPAGEPVSDAVAKNGRVLAEPTAPPFRLLDRSLPQAAMDRATDRPYCSLRYHAGTQSFYLCAFSGIDKPSGGGRNFSKNLSDALLRYDLRTQQWHEVERHDSEAGGNYPHHDPQHAKPPHGWLNGPDNCLPVGDWLYAVAKDNSLLVRYDLRPLIAEPDAGAPPSHWVLGDQIAVEGQGVQRFAGHSMLAQQGDWLYLGFRTSSEIVRFKLDEQGLPVQPIVAQVVARFDPYDPATRRSANLTDMAFDGQGRLYVISAQPARVYRFTPDAAQVYDARGGVERPWADVGELVGARGLKSENILVDDLGRVYVTIADTYGDSGAQSVVYRLRER
jgi:hypothetical protein